MEFRNILTFVRLAEVRNFSKTAQQLGYSQSAVTAQIQQLERELDAQLFERIGRQVKLTQAGQRFLPRALDILNAVHRAESVVQEPEQVTGSLRIGTCESYVISVLPPILTQFIRRFPQVEVRMITGDAQDLFNLLRQNDADLLFFLDQKVYSPDWIKLLERPERVHFVASAQCPLAGRKNIPIPQLLTQPLFLTEQGVSYRYAMEQALAAQGFELHPVLEVGNTDVITRFLLDNEGISFLPEYVVREHLRNGRLVILDTQCPDIPMWSQLVYHRNKFVSPQMRVFLQLLSGSPVPLD